MKNYTLFLSISLLLLFGCATDPSSISSSLSLSSASTSLSSTSDQTSSSSSSTVSTTSSTASSTPSSSSSDSMMTALNSKWSQSLGNIDTTLYYGETIPLTSSLSNSGVIEVVSVYQLDNATLYGYAFESLVSGNGGLIRFRVGIRLNLFTGFHVVSDSEHTNFGRLILNSLSNNLAGKDATYEAALNVLIQASLNRSGLTQTFDGVMPAIDAIADFYQGRNSNL